MAGTLIAVIGRKTESKLSEHGIRADFVPNDYRASSLAELLQSEVTDRSVTIIRASRGSDELPDKLGQFGAVVQEIIAYQNIDVEQADPVAAAALNDGKVDWITVTSSATAANLCRLYGDRLKKARIAAISPVTASVLKDHGLDVDAIAEPYTIEALLDEIIAKS